MRRYTHTHTSVRIRDLYVSSQEGKQRQSVLIVVVVVEHIAWMCAIVGPPVLPSKPRYGTRRVCLLRRATQSYALRCAALRFPCARTAAHPDQPTKPAICQKGWKKKRKGHSPSNTLHDGGGDGGGGGHAKGYSLSCFCSALFRQTPSPSSWPLDRTMSTAQAEHLSAPGKACRAR